MARVWRDRVSRVRPRHAQTEMERDRKHVMSVERALALVLLMPATRDLIYKTEPA